MAFPVIQSQLTATITTTGTITVAKPSGVTEGDLLLAFRSASRVSSDVLNFNTPSGWTITGSGEVTGVIDQGNSPLRAAWYWKIAGASEPSDYSFTISGGTHHTHHITIFRITGYDISVPFIEASLSPVFATRTSYNAPVVSSVNSDALILHAFNIAGDRSITTDPAYTTLVTENLLGTTNQTIRAGSRHQASPGNTSTQDWTYSATNAAVATWTLVINSPASGGRTPKLLGNGLFNGLLNNGLIG